MSKLFLAIVLICAAIILASFLFIVWTYPETPVIVARILFTTLLVGIPFMIAYCELEDNKDE